MTKSADDGGSAFPNFDVVWSAQRYGLNGDSIAVPTPIPQGGMTLRDYFAARIVPSLVMEAKTTQHAAIMAYEIADAMLLVRSKGRVDAQS